jgi:hypothetical protein
MADQHTLGAQFVQALAAQDFDRVEALLHPEVDSAA